MSWCGNRLCLCWCGNRLYLCWCGNRLYLCSCIRLRFNWGYSLCNLWFLLGLLSYFFCRNRSYNILFSFLAFFCFCRCSFWLCRSWSGSRGNSDWSYNSLLDFLAFFCFCRSSFWLCWSWSRSRGLNYWSNWYDRSRLNCNICHFLR